MKIEVQFCGEALERLNWTFICYTICMEHILPYLDSISNFVSLEVVLLGLALGLVVNLLLVLRIGSTNNSRTKSSIPIPGSSHEQFQLLNNKIESLSREAEKNQESIERVSLALPQTALVRYNPFRDSGVGGNQSFSLASVDSQGNGFMITHLFSREMSRVQSKEIKKWESEVELSPEEQQTLDQLKK